MPIDLGSIAAAFTSLNAVSKIAQGVMSLKTMAEVQSVAIDLNQKIISAQNDIFAAQAAQSGLVQKLHNLEEQIAEMRHWEEQKKNYRLAEPWGGGGLVYGVKESCKQSEGPHWICTKCYDDGRRSILNPIKDAKFYIVMTCPTCKAQIHTGMHGIGSPNYI